MVYPIRHYFPDIRANHRPGCWKQLPLPVPHCWQYRRRLESIATVCIMIADPSLEVCVPRHLSRLWGRSTAVTAVSSRQNRDAPAETLLGLRQGQLYVAGDSDIRLSRCRKGGRGLFCPSILYTRKRVPKFEKKFAFFLNLFSAHRIETTCLRVVEQPIAKRTRNNGVRHPFCQEKIRP